MRTFSNNRCAHRQIIIKLKSKDEASLRERFKVTFPRGVRLIGRQVDLTPPQAWTEDHYQRQLGYSCRSANIWKTRSRALGDASCIFKSR